LASYHASDLRPLLATKLRSVRAIEFEINRSVIVAANFVSTRHDCPPARQPWLIARRMPKGDTPTLLELVEEPLDEIAPAIQVRAKAHGLPSIALNIGPRALLIDERPDLVSVISSICQQH